MPASSSRRSVVKGLGALALGALAVWALNRFRSVAPPEDECGPKLAYRQLSVRNNGQDDAVQRGNALWLVLASLPRQERQELIDTLDALVTAIEARATPGLIDLTSADVRAELEGRRAWLLPLVNAASALLQPSWSGSGVEVRVLDGPARPDERVVRAWSQDPADDWASRARFAAWAVSGAMWIGTADEDERNRVASLLRESLPRVDSPIALVIDVGIVRRTEEPPELGALLTSVRKHRRALREARRGDATVELVESLADADSHSLLPWLELRPGDLLIVPRLGSLARRDAFRSAVLQALSTTGVTAKTCSSQIA